MNTQKAIQAIDAVTAAIVNRVINAAFIDKLIYGKLDNELYKHVLNKWESKKGDVFDFYLNANDDIERWLLEALGVEVEPNRYPDYDSRITAQIEGKNRSEIYPFETEIVHSFFLFGYNYSLDELKKVSPSAWQTVITNNIDRYGNYKNWSLFWEKASREDKAALLEYINK
ncbi:hypothetical protein [Bacteroides eggerthii]|uniref:hypothetical protein n=1 Tax=Bacteroides eggerthii TaxID=28111 RepID=UPI0035676605